MLSASATVTRAELPPRYEADAGDVASAQRDAGIRLASGKASVRRSPSPPPIGWKNKEFHVAVARS
jgi:hypothetical protein